METKALEVREYGIALSAYSDCVTGDVERSLRIPLANKHKKGHAQDCYEAWEAR